MKLFIPGAFFLLTGWFLVGPRAPSIPIPGPAAVSATDLVTTPPRRVLTDPPRVRIGGVDQRCSDCHRLFETTWSTQTQFKQHAHIVLNHGLNEACVNCHSEEDRNRLLLRGGEQIGYDDVARLCAKCHGTVYRDWQAGTHGRTNGYWDTSRGERRRLVCTECHDPHSPAYDPVVPLPGPNTFRMGSQGPAPAPHGPERNPLRKWAESARTGDQHE